jgi:hypothetical protein
MSMTRDDIMEAADHEGQLNVAVDELSERGGDITLDDIKNLPGAGDLSDAELQSLYEETQGESSSEGKNAEAIAGAIGGEAVETSRGWKVYDDKGVEVKIDPDKTTLKEFLNYQIGYQATGKEHRKKFDDVLRVAQYGHMNEQKLGTIRGERDQFYKQLQEAMPELQGNRQILTTIRHAMTQYTVGNPEPLAQLLEKFKSNLGGTPGMASMGGAEQAAPQNDTEAEGVRIYHEYIMPMANGVAEEFKLAPEVRTQLKAAVDKFINDEPMLTNAKLESYIQQEIPMLLEQAGFKRGGVATQAPAAAASVPSDEIAQLRKEIAALKAGQSNSLVTNIRNKNAKIPGQSSAGTQQIETPEDGVPKEATKSAAAYRKFLGER